MPLLGALQVQEIRRNYRGGDLSANQLIDILEHRVAYGAERASRVLVRLMCARKHYTEKAHTSTDKTMHYLMRVGSKSCHLRLDARGVVFQITDEQGHDLGTVPPWVAPGAS